MPHSTSETLKVMSAKGLANHREFDIHFYMSFNKIVIAEFLQVEELIDEKDGAEQSFRTAFLSAEQRIEHLAVYLCYKYY